MNVIAASAYGPIIINTNDLYIGKQILTLGTWAAKDQEVMAAILRCILQNKNTAVAYDVGANVGIHSLFLAKTFGKAIRLRAFEAQEEVFHMLCGTVAINNLRNISCHFNAVSDKSGEIISFALPDYETPNNFGGLELVTAINSDNNQIKKTHNMQNASTVMLDDFHEEVDFIKIDIEGMELTALEGAYRCIARHRPFVFCELFKSDRDKIFDFFSNFGYIALHDAQDGIFIPVGSNFDISICKQAGFQLR